MKIKEQTRKLAAGCTWVRQGEADVVWIWFSKSINSRKIGQDFTPDLFLLQNDKNHKLFDKYACQKEKDVLQ